jgi:hypothetical protein
MELEIFGDRVNRAEDLKYLNEVAPTGHHVVRVTALREYCMFSIAHLRSLAEDSATILSTSRLNIALARDMRFAFHPA